MKLINTTSPINWNHPLNRGLVRKWVCLPQRTGGNTWRELTRRSNASINGATARSPRSRPGGWGSYEFDGTNDGAQTGTIDLSSVSTLTISMWLWWNSYGSADDIALETSANYNSNDGAIIIDPDWSASANFATGLRTGAGTFNIYTFPRPTAARWNHYVFCYDRGGGAQQVTAVYVNGVSQTLTSAFTSSTSGNFGNHQWNFMARNNGSAIQGDGVLDDVSIHSRVLSASEALQLYRESRAGYPTLLRWLPGMPFFGEGDAPGDTPTFFATEINRKRKRMATYLGEQELDNTALASAAALTVPAGTNYMTVEAIGGTMNYELDGVSNVPTTTTTGAGSRLYDTGTVAIDCGFTTFRIIRQTSVAAQIVKVHYYGGAR